MLRPSVGVSGIHFKVSALCGALTAAARMRAQSLAVFEAVPSDRLRRPMAPAILKGSRSALVDGRPCHVRTERAAARRNAYRTHSSHGQGDISDADGLMVSRMMHVPGAMGPWHSHFAFSSRTG